MQTEQATHLDLFGHPLQVGDIVAFASGNSLIIGSVSKLSKKQIRIFPVTFKKSVGYLKYSKETIKLDGPDVTLFLLKNSK